LLRIREQEETGNKRKATFAETHYLGQVIRECSAN
jgi:hypothetical protein